MRGKVTEICKISPPLFVPGLHNQLEDRGVSIEVEVTVWPFLSNLFTVQDPVEILEHSDIFDTLLLSPETYTKPSVPLSKDPVSIQQRIFGVVVVIY